MTCDNKDHGDKPIEFCGDQEGWIAVDSLTDDSPNSPCYPRVVLLGVGLGPAGKAHPSNIAAMLTVEQATDLRTRLTEAIGVDRLAPTPAPGLDLDAVERSASSFAKYHTEHARFGGASREFHERAETFIGATVPALIAEVRALRAERDSALDSMATAHVTAAKVGDELIATRAKLAEAKRLGLEFVEFHREAENCDGWGPFAAIRSKRMAAIAAALEAL